MSAPVTILDRSPARWPESRWPEYGLNGCAFAFLPLLVLASRGVTALAAVAGVLGLVLVGLRHAAGWRGLAVPGLLLLGVVVWGLVSALWAVQPGRSVLIAVRLAGLFAAVLALAAAAPCVAAPRRLLACLAAGLILALVLTAWQFATNGGLTGPFFKRVFVVPRLNQADTAYLLLVLPLTAALVRCGRKLLAAVLAIATVAAILGLVDTTAKAGFGLAVVAAAALYAAPRAMARVAAAASVVVILTAPLTFPALLQTAPARSWAQGFHKISALHRLEIWSFAGARIAERPLAGWGLDASRAIPGGSALTPLGVPWLPLHPHNAALQVWLELGLPGALLLAAVVARLWLALAEPGWPRGFAAAAGGSLAAALTVGLGSYGIWQEWWVGTEALVLFLILALARAADQPRPETLAGSTS